MAGSGARRVQGVRRGNVAGSGWGRRGGKVGGCRQWGWSGGGMK